MPAGCALHELTLVYLQVVSGSRVGVPAGRALYQLNDRMTGEERALARRECALFMDADGFVSPAKLYVWFATGTDYIISVCYQVPTSMVCHSVDSILSTWCFTTRICGRHFLPLSSRVSSPVKVFHNHSMHLILNYIITMAYTSTRHISLASLASPTKHHTSSHSATSPLAYMYNLWVSIQGELINATFVNIAGLQDAYQHST